MEIAGGLGKPYRDFEVRTWDQSQALLDSKGRRQGCMCLDTVPCTLAIVIEHLYRI